MINLSCSGRKTRALSLHLALASTCLCLFAGPTAAQTPAPIPLPQTITVSPGGVDLQSGTYRYSHDDLSSGDLTLTRTWTGWSGQNDVDLYDRNENGIAHNFRAALIIQRVPRPEGGRPETHDWLVSVHIGDRTQVFRRMWSANSLFSPNGGGKGTSLTFTGGNVESAQIYTFTDKDGTAYIFGTPAAGAGVSPGCASAAGPCAYVSTVKRPNGDQLDFDYGTSGPLRMVRNNKGFAIAFEYSGYLLIKACAINLAYQAFTPGTACPAGAPAAFYAYSSATYTYTSPANATSSFSIENLSLSAKSVTLPSSAQPWLTLQATGCGPTIRCVSRQDFGDGSWWTYTGGGAGGGAVGSQTGLLTGSFTGPAGTTSYTIQQGQSWDRDSQAYFYVPAGGPQSVTDPLNRTTNADYCVVVNSICSAQQVPQSVTNPEGDQAVYTYDVLDNITQAVFKAKPGSGLADRSMSATYQYGLPGGLAKPLTITDARGATTSFSYDPAHGGVLTLTKPADDSGKQAQTRYSYVQRQAWVANGSGGYVADPNSVWLLASESFCRTSNFVSGACQAGAGDLVTTTYDYGPNSGPNNLLLRGTTSTADGTSRRTCFLYDQQGNRIAETKPRAGLTSCP